MLSWKILNTTSGNFLQFEFLVVLFVTFQLGFAGTAELGAHALHFLPQMKFLMLFLDHRVTKSWYLATRP